MIHRCSQRLRRDPAVLCRRGGDRISQACSDVSVESLHAKITASAGSPDQAILSDGDLEKTTKLPIPAAGESAWIQYEFQKPQTIQSLTIATKGMDRIAALVTGITNPEKSLQVSDDGQSLS